MSSKTFYISLFVLFVAVVIVEVCRTDVAALDTAVGTCIIINPEFSPEGVSPFVYRIIGSRGANVFIEQRRWVDTFDTGWCCQRAVEKWLLQRMYVNNPCPEDK